MMSHEDVSALPESILLGYCQCGCGQKTTVSKHTSTKHGRIAGQPTRYLAGHARRPATLDYRLDTETGCWLWARAVDPAGFPLLSPLRDGNRAAHVWYYSQAFGRPPKGRYVTQTCGRRTCVNPAHLALKPTQRENFWEFVAKSSDPNGCWIWEGTRVASGYGRVDDRPTHVIAWELCVGPIPEGMCVLHRCDNRPCVNPAHLFLGTKGDNARDMVAKRRSLIGERNHKAKLTDADVTEIRRRDADGATLAARFGITRDQVYRIWQGKAWSHVG